MSREQRTPARRRSLEKSRLRADCGLLRLGGTEVRFADSDGRQTGRDAGRVELTIRGSLRVEGTAERPVALRGASARSAVWYGISVEPSATLVHVRQLEVRDALRGLSYEHGGAVLDARNVVFRSNQHSAIYVTRGTATLDSVEMYGPSEYGVYLLDQRGAVTVSNCIARGNDTGID